MPADNTSLAGQRNRAVGSIERARPSHAVECMTSPSFSGVIPIPEADSSPVAGSIHQEVSNREADSSYWADASPDKAPSRVPDGNRGEPVLRREELAVVWRRGWEPEAGWERA